MRRAILAVTATVAGLVALLSFKTHSSSERTVASPAACCTSSRVTDPSGPLPVSADRSPSSAMSKSFARAALVTASPAPAGASPARSRALARPASASSMACSHALSSMIALPRANTPPNKLPEVPAC